MPEDLRTDTDFGAGSWTPGRSSAARTGAGAPSHWQPTDSLFTAHGRRLGATRLRVGLLAAAEHAGLTGPGGAPLIVTCHQLRHTYATSLANGVAHGYCSRHAAGEACPYANICETCENYTPAAEFIPALTDQLADVHALQADAKQRGWDSETARTPASPQPWKSTSSGSNGSRPTRAL